MAESFVLVLAGGQGSRVQSRTRGIPKQFCDFGTGHSLLACALQRACRIAGRHRILPVVSSAHRHLWEPELSGVPPANVIEQREPRGTAGAVLRGVVEALSRDLNAAVIVLPSDHAVEDEAVLGGSIRDLVRAAQDWPGHLVLLGMIPEAPDEGYGWILPSVRAGDATSAVEAFVEKPDPEEMSRLVGRGAIVNSFIVAGTGRAFLELFSICLPELFAAWDPAAGAGEGVPAWDMPDRDFSRDLLAQILSRLRVLRAPPCGWSDLGTPERLERWLERRGRRMRAEHRAAPVGTAA